MYIFLFNTLSQGDCNTILVSYMCMLSFMYVLTCRPSLHSSDNRHPTFCDIMTCFSWDGQETQHD